MALPKPLSNLPAVPPLAILPLPPNEYDPLYMTKLVQVLNFFMQQAAYPGLVNCTAISIFTNKSVAGYSKDPEFIFNTQSDNVINDWVVKLLPTSPVGLASQQIWQDTATGNLKITP
jgi:hypothetical protein